MQATQQGWIYDPLPKRFDQGHIECGDHTDGFDMDGPQQTIAILLWQEYPDERGVYCRIADFTYRLGRVHVEHGERAVLGSGRNQ